MNIDTNKTNQRADSSETNWMLDAMEAERRGMMEAQERDYQDTLRRELAEEEALWEPEDGSEFFERERHLPDEPR